MSYARTTDPSTSWEAADSLSKDHVARVREQVQAYALHCGTRGFTDKELEAYFDDFGSTYRTRRSELSAAGVIVATDTKRKTPSGRNAIVHVHYNHTAGHQFSLI
tara:strand:+ start:265 stop:579 length:315 start_codon:yes stop_codon:yes gene_type:complete